MKHQPKNLTEGLTPPKRLHDTTRLPQYFDTLWDIKWGSQVYSNLYGILEKEDFFRALAEHGFDAAAVRKYAENRKNA